MRIRLTFTLVILLLSVFSPDAFAGVGHTPGQFGVSSTGSAQYTIPIWTPPGIRGLQPHLALAYDSGSPAGILGPGWNLAGLSTIARCNRTYAQDGTPAAITLTMADAFCLDGRRLRLTSSETLSTYGQPGTTYQTEIANFSDVTAYGTAGNGPSYFTVKGNDGLTYEYGNTTDSRVLATGATTPYSWALDKVTDRSGNYMTYTYVQSSGAFVLSSIQYTASASSTFVYQLKFGYATVSAPTVIYYLSGAQIQQTQQLSTVSVQLYNTTTDLRVYKLSYTNSLGTVRPRLATIQECGGSTGTDCLAATNVAYQNGSVGVASPTTAAGSGATNGNVYSVDIDGDGRQDLVFATTNSSGASVWWVQFATASGYGTPISTGASSMDNFAQNGGPSLVIDDFDGKGANEIIAEHGGTLYLYKWNGSAFTATSLGIAALSDAIYASADVDGDGRPDLVYLMTWIDWEKTPISVKLNTTTGSTVTFAAPVTTNWSTQYCCQSLSTQLIGNNVSRGSSIKHMDFDGDGRDDLILTTLNYHPATNSYSTLLFTLLSRGTGPFAVGTVSNTKSVIFYPTVLPVHWNDDACTDVTFQATVVISKCDGSYASVIPIGTQPTLALDWDGDGRTDLLANVGGVWQLYRSLGNGAATPVSTGISVGSGSWTVTEKNGDGLSDLAFAQSSSSNAIYFGLHNGAGQRPDLLSSINDGYGNSVSPTYVSLAQSNYSQYGDAAWPYLNYIGPMYVVSAATFSDPSNLPGGTYSQQFYYYGAWVNRQGRGFQAFNTTRMIDSRTGLYNYQYYERSFPYSGMIYQDIVSTGVFYPSQSIGTHALKTLDTTVNNQRYFPYFSNVTSTQREVGGSENGDLITTTSANYTYDSYGNATNVAATVTDNDPGSPYYSDQWTTTTVNTIAPNASTWCLSLPTATTVTNSSTAPGGAAITRTIDYTPDYTKCRETQKVIEPNSATYKVIEDYSYDTNFGNLHSYTVTGVGMTPRVTTIGWTANGQFPLTITNPLSQSITLGFDPNTGMKTSQTDLNYTTTNPLKTTWGYDNFARKTSELRPDGTSTTWSYNACATNGCVNSNNRMTLTQTVLNVGGTTQSITNTYLDSIDRTLVTSSTLLSGAYDRNEVQYDNLGRIHQQGAPCTFVSCTNYWTTFGYDVLNRVIQSQRPISATNGTLQTTTVAYAGRATTTTDALNHATTKITMVTGTVGRSKDTNGYYQNFTFDTLGSLLSVTDNAIPSNTLFSAQYAYGAGAFQTDVTDMDLDVSTAPGQHRHYVYNALGELSSYSDAKGNSTMFDPFDALGRPTKRTETDLTTTWTWGNTAGSYNIGKLYSVTATGSAGTYSEVYTFDSKSRLSLKNITIPGDAAYGYAYTYNPTTQLLDTLQYPQSTSYQLKLQYTYANGLLKSISDANALTTVFWTANATNPRGQVTQETLGNGVVTNRSFDAVTGWIGSIQSGVGGGAALQNNGFLFDLLGNVTQRQNSNLGLTENFYYDALNRLDHSTLGSNTNLQMCYDNTSGGCTANLPGPGNITSRSDIAGGAAWTYDPVRKHSVTQAGSSANSYSYDANGNAQTRNGFSVTWTSYNYPSSINAAGESVAFSYGPDRQRWKSIYSTSIGTETTYHVGKLLEKVINGGTTDYRHYIFAGNEQAAIYSRTNTGTNTLRYVLEDNQGSIASITTSTGTNYVNESFTAYGDRRNGNTWSGAPTSGDETLINAVSREGYTGQTVLGVRMGLNHMNGRVQDAITGRFLSADPYIPDPGDTQSFNRYSYVNNNPVTLVDPTGFDDWGTPANGCTDVPLECNNTGSPGFGGGGGATPSGGGRPEGGRRPTKPVPKKPPPPAQSPELPEIVVTAPHPKRLFGTHWCGPGGGGPPVNDLDAACKAHDQCFDNIGFSASSNFNNLSATDAANVKACDQLLCNSAQQSNARGSTLTDFYFSIVVNSNVACD
jgi:RHS repeat-associated protein